MAATGVAINYNTAAQIQEAEKIRGFTGHEWVASANMGHFNGRIYDYEISAFLGPDKLIQSNSIASLNRFSLGLNNNPNITDPSGWQFRLVRGTQAVGTPSERLVNRGFFRLQRSFRRHFSENSIQQRLNTQEQGSAMSAILTSQLAASRSLVATDMSLLVDDATEIGFIRTTHSTAQGSNSVTNISIHPNTLNLIATGSFSADEIVNQIDSATRIFFGHPTLTPQGIAHIHADNLIQLGIHSMQARWADLIRFQTEEEALAASQTKIYDSLRRAPHRLAQAMLNIPIHLVTDGYLIRGRQLFRDTLRNDLAHLRPLSSPNEVNTYLQYVHDLGIAERTATNSRIEDTLRASYP